MLERVEGFVLAYCCHANGQGQSQRSDLSGWALSKLTSKNQSAERQAQAVRSVGLYYDLVAKQAQELELRGGQPAAREEDGRHTTDQREARQIKPQPRPVGRALLASHQRLLNLPVERNLYITGNLQHEWSLFVA